MPNSVSASGPRVLLGGPWSPYELPQANIRRPLKTNGTGDFTARGCERLAPHSGSAPSKNGAVGREEDVLRKKRLSCNPIPLHLDQPATRTTHDASDRSFRTLTGPSSRSRGSSTARQSVGTFGYKKENLRAVRDLGGSQRSTSLFSHALGNST
jgi:hypothetical protein